jgi:hypothetical protein
MAPWFTLAHAGSVFVTRICGLYFLLGAANDGVKKIGPTVNGSATSTQLPIAWNTEHSYYSRMLVRNLIRVCGEELLKAKRATVFVYGAIREADERTMDLLMIFLGIR